MKHKHRYMVPVEYTHGWRQHGFYNQGFLGVLGTRFGPLELKIGSLESEKSGPYRVPNIFINKTCYNV